MALNHKPRVRKTNKVSRHRTPKTGAFSSAWIVLFVMVAAIGGFLLWGGNHSQQNEGFGGSKDTKITEAVSDKMSDAVKSVSDTVKKGLEKVGKKKEESTDATKGNAKDGEKIALVNHDKNVDNTAKERQGKGGAEDRAKMAIVIDDCGYSYDIITKYNSIGIPLTYAVLPYEQYSTAVATAGHNAGQDIMVHLPMESESNVTPESTTIRTSMGSSEVQAITTRALDSVPYAIGVNNHQGSKATADRTTMTAVMKEIHRQHMFFLDSRTTSASVGQSVAENMGVPTGVNELFLDNDSSVGSIKEKLQEAARMALRSSGGYIIVIGHARPNTEAAIAAMKDTLESEGIEFVFVKSLLH